MEEEAPTFDKALVSKFDKDIKYLIKTKVFNYQSSDMCYEYDDVYSECLSHLWNATKIYDPTRGMKFRSFAIFHMKSRLGNLRNKTQRKNKAQTISMSQLNGGWGITGREENLSESEFTSYSQYSSFLGNPDRAQEALAEIIDTKHILNTLSGHKKTMFIEYYIKGKKIKEICQENPDIKYHKTRQYRKSLDAIYKTLIKGETPCLK